MHLESIVLPEARQNIHHVARIDLDVGRRARNDISSQMTIVHARSVETESKLVSPAELGE